MSLIMICTRYHSCSEHRSRRMWVHDMNKHTNRLSSLCYDLSDILYSSRDTETANTSFSSIFESWLIFHSLKQQNSTKIHCPLKSVPVTSPVFFWRVKKFQTLKLKALRRAAKKRQSTKKMLGAALVLRVATCCRRRSLFIKNYCKKTLALRENNAM